MSEERLLTFEIARDRELIDIHCNREGLDDLIYYLTRLRDNSEGTPQHDHLMTPNWAGTELTQEAQGSESNIVNKVTIHLW